MSGPLVIAATATAGTGVGTTRDVYRADFADQMGLWHRTTVSTLATSGDTTRVVLADEFRDDEAGYDALGAPWLYVVNGAQAGAQRRAISQPGVGYRGSVGGLAVSRPFTAAIAAGTIVEATAPLPIGRYVGQKGLHVLLEEAAERVKIEVRLSIVGNGTYGYDLADEPWIWSDAQFRGIYDSVLVTPLGEPQISPFPARFVTNGPDHTLVTPRQYSSDQTFVLALVVSANRYLYDGATWAYRQPSVDPWFTSDTMAVAAPVRHMTALAMVKGLEQWLKMLQLRPMPDIKERLMMQDDVRERLRQWRSTANRIILEEFPAPFRDRPEPLLGGIYQIGEWV